MVDFVPFTTPKARTKNGREVGRGGILKIPPLLHRRLASAHGFSAKIPISICLFNTILNIFMYLTTAPCDPPLL